MIQYNLARLRSMPATNGYRRGFDAMKCAEPGCNRWRIDEELRYCRRHIDPGLWVFSHGAKEQKLEDARKRQRR